MSRLNRRISIRLCNDSGARKLAAYGSREVVGGEDLCVEERRGEMGFKDYYLKRDDCFVEYEEETVSFSAFCRW